MQETVETKNIRNMKRIILIAIASLLVSASVNAQTPQKQQGLKKVYNEDINQLEQIDKAVSQAKKEGKYVICQLGGNWCPWCLKFADFITKDAEISNFISDNFVYIHVNYNPRMVKSKDESVVKRSAELMKRLDNAGRFGYPVFIVLDKGGKVLHIQDSSFLEEGEGYNKDKVIRFFKNWTPKAVGR